MASSVVTRGLTKRFASRLAVSAVDIEPAGEDVPELRSDAAAARVELATAAGTRQVTVSAGYGLKLAVAAGAPISTALLGLNGLFGLAGWQIMYIAEDGATRK